MQKLLSFIIAVVILYGIFQSQMRSLEKNYNKNKQEKSFVEQKSISDKNTSEQETEFSGGFIEKTLSKVLVNALKTEEGKAFFENIISHNNKPLADGKSSIKVNNNDLITGILHINTFGEGSVGPASCGHIVTAHYQIMTMGGVTVDEQTKTFTLGSRTILSGLDSVIVGMMIGQTRQAILPAKFAYAESKYQKAGIDPALHYKVNIVLKEIMPKNFIKGGEVKIFDDEIAYKMPLMCGDRTSFDATITQISNGKILFDSSSNKQKISINVGDLNYPLIFAHALHNKVPVGSRVIIAKGRTFNGIADGYSKIFPKTMLNAEEYFLLELKNFTE